MHRLVDLPPQTYCSYYKQQTGGNIPYFVGGKQYGRGFGNMLAKFARGFVLPTLSKVGSAIKKTGSKRALSFGSDVLSDVIAGKNLKTSLKERGVHHAKGAAKDLLGLGPRSRRRGKKIVRKRRQRSRQDIFT